VNTQLRLPGLDPPGQVTPAAGRSAPTFWVRRIVVVREFGLADENIIRDVALRRGLNVVWTPPLELTTANALFKSGVAGHTAGKSTFCRLLRYAIGDRNFATERARKRIRDRFPKGWVLAEVDMAGSTWAVARPFAIGPHSFCVEGGALARLFDSPRSDYARFLDALTDVTIAPLPSRTFPTSDEPVQWDHLLPWMSRDQECRFADFLEWRHSSSEADSPSLNSDERQFLVRAVLGLISDAEREEQLRNARLVFERKEATRLAPLLAHEASRDRNRVQSLLGAHVSSASTELFGSEANAELQRQIADVEGRLSALAASDPRSALRTRLDRAIENETNARRDLEDATSRTKSEEGALETLRAPSSPHAASLLAGLPPPRDYCNVPMTLARERGCPLATSRPIELAARRSERSAKAELEEQAKLVLALKATIEEKGRKCDAAARVTTEARRALAEATATFEKERERDLAERSRLAQVAVLVRDAEQAWTKSLEQLAAIETLGAQVEDSYAKQEEIRRGGRVALGHFSSTFDYVVRALIGDEVGARVDTTGRSLALVIEHRGERESAALETVKLLAFDLAAVTESIQGRGNFPRFLLHDGPREADMAADIYERLFLFARRLEECFQDEPGFQYIVTTTTRPPEEFLREPWRRLTLSGVPAEERLLRCDL
jgi:hypothetical protein